MINLAQYLLLLSIVLLSSCSRYKEVVEYRDYGAHYLQAQRDYCSTNFLEAERGLLNFRNWIDDRDRSGKPRFNYHLNLLQVNARLFLLYELQRETNKAEAFYQAGVRAYSEYLQSQKLPDHILSKEEMRERLARQEEGLTVEWKKHQGGSEVPP